MKELDKRSIENILKELDKLIDSDIEQPPTKFSIIAVGGTSLTLRNIKNSTKDVDFMVDGIEFDKAKKYFSKLIERLQVKIDKWESPHVFSTTLPKDYETEIYRYNFKHFDFLLLNLVDVAATKISRLNDRDIEDIRSILKQGIKTSDIAKRCETIIKTNGFANNDEARKNIELFKKLFSQ